MLLWIAIPLIPFLAFVGIVGAIVSLLRGKRRSAVIWLTIGVGAVVTAITMYYTSI